jgi:hypothetical protein
MKVPEEFSYPFSSFTILNSLKHMFQAKFKICVLFSLILICCLCISCGSDGDKDGVPDDKDKEKNTPLNAKVDFEGREIKEKQINNIHFYIETSASMAGYFKNDAEFRTILSDLVSKIDKKIKPIDISFIADSTTKYSKSIENFMSDIATTKIADQKSSQLHNIIQKIANANGKNDISLLVSDCILSFPDADIKKNPEINKTEAPNSLKNNVFSTFSNLNVNGLATSIYAFNSKFYGTYYDYQNGKHYLNGDKRPFYIWVIGDKGILGKFNTSLSDISTFMPERSLHFGLTEEPVTTYDIIPQIERKGKWMKDITNIKDIKITQTEPIQFCLALDLTNLPLYAKDVNYLQDNLKLDFKGCDVAYVVKTKDKADRSKLKSEQQIALFEKATHVFLITVKSMNLPKSDIQITLPLKYDTWYMDWSCMDDKNTSAIADKSFAFEYLINGVKEAYETKNKDYINFTITLTK